MVNETVIYSSLQNIPFITQVATIAQNVTTPQTLATLGPGIYQIRFSGSMVGGNAGTREFVINNNTVLQWNQNQSLQQQVDLFIRIGTSATLQITAGITPTVALAYQLSYRNTPSLDLITKAELDAINEEINNQVIILEQSKKDDHKKKDTSRGLKDASKGENK